MLVMIIEVVVDDICISIWCSPIESLILSWGLKSWRIPEVWLLHFLSGVVVESLWLPKVVVVFYDFKVDNKTDLYWLAIMNLWKKKMGVSPMGSLPFNGRKSTSTCYGISGRTCLNFVPWRGFLSPSNLVKPMLLPRHSWVTSIDQPLKRTYLRSCSCNNIRIHADIESHLRAMGFAILSHR